MAAQEMQVATASAADLAADMEYHRQTYARFMSLLKYSSAGAALILIILFFIMI